MNMDISRSDADGRDALRDNDILPYYGPNDRPDCLFLHYEQMKMDKLNNWWKGRID